MPDDLEAFLRKAAEQRLARKRRAKGAAQPATPPVAQPAKKAPPPQSQPVVATPVSPERLPSGTGAQESVGEHVAHHIQSEKIAESARQLGDRVRKEEEAFESRLESVFDHQVGTLSGERTEATRIGEKSDKQKAAARSFLTDLFQNKDQLRKAIVLREILSPPPGLSQNEERY